MRVFGREPIDSYRARVPRGRVYLIPERCKGCGICIAFCPSSILQESKEANGRGYHLPAIAKGKQDACIHCQFCSLVCPEFAIFTKEVAL
jgi:2-oxoglutarate ferredoxin oxidoreductase subunit delta